MKQLKKRSEVSFNSVEAYTPSYTCRCSCSCDSWITRATIKNAVSRTEYLDGLSVYGV